MRDKKTFSAEPEPYTVRSMRADFLSMPAHLQTQAIERVLDRLQCEIRRRQNQPSALARLAGQVYGVRSQDLSL